VAELSYSALEDIKTVGIHRYMDELQVKLNEIGEAIYQTYLFSPPMNVLEAEEPPAEPMMQTQTLGPDLNLTQTEPSPTPTAA
jgi:hypothetical protein